jgi:hypothetical protein
MARGNLWLPVRQSPSPGIWLGWGVPWAGWGCLGRAGRWLWGMGGSFTGCPAATAGRVPPGGRRDSQPGHAARSVCHAGRPVTELRPLKNRGVLWLTGPLLVTGIGMGMLTAPLTGIVLAQVAPQHVGTVSGLQSTTVQLGNSLGVAVIGVVFFGALAGGFGHAFGATLAWLTVLPLAASVAIQVLPRRSG